MEFIYKVPERKKYIRNFVLYVLELEHGKYYVGISKNVKKRYKMHKKGEGAEWTKLHKPIKILFVRDLGYCSYKNVKDDENSKTIEMMKRYGRENVRGGIYCAVDQGVVDNFLGEELCKKIDKVHSGGLYKVKGGEKKKKKGRSLKSIKGFSIITYDEKLFDKDGKFETRYISIILSDKKNNVKVEVDYENRKIYVSNLDMQRYGDQIKSFL